MSEAITARQRAATRRAALTEGPALTSGMTLGPPQVYLGWDVGGYFLYRSPDGRKRVPMEGRYPTPRAAEAARMETSA